MPTLLAAALVATLLGQQTTTQPQKIDPSLLQPFQVMMGTVALQLGVGHAAPNMSDWTGDGLPDLLVGQFEDGALYLLPNEGTRGNPRFTKRVAVEVGGKPATVDFG